MPRPSPLPVCVALALFIGTAIQAAAPPKPVYGWKVLSDSTWELQALDTRRFSIPSTGKLRVSVQADYAVFGGVFYASKSPRTPLAPQFNRAACPLISAVKAEVTCDLQHTSKLVYLVRDKRSLISVAGATAFASHGMLKPMEHATAGNRAHITISEWVCTANCGHVPD